VLAEACRQMAAWRDAGLALPPRLAINISARQVEDAAFPAQAGGAIRRAGLAPSLFEIELTEGSMMRNVELAIDLLGQLRADGLGVALDDFGTGYSSLASLRRLPAEKLKIDRSFVGQLLEDANDRAIVATIIAMGRGLGLRTVAEGVETEAQAAELRTMGCDCAQGYLFGYPEEAARFAATWLQPGRTPVRQPAG
jgi:EAL domain-containing protein (putative c-di-GMP-specific phosphodiesterase class I)